MLLPWERREDSGACRRPRTLPAHGYPRLAPQVPHLRRIDRSRTTAHARRDVEWLAIERQRPSLWLGCAGDSVTGGSCASIPDRADPMHVRMSAMSLVLSLADAHLASGRTSITPSARRCKAELRRPQGDRENRGHRPAGRLAQPDLGAGEEAPDQLLANPANQWIHPKTQQDALARALDAVGWVQQVLVNRRTGFVVDGHARVVLAVPVHPGTISLLVSGPRSPRECTRGRALPRAREIRSTGGCGPAGLSQRARCCG